MLKVLPWLCVVFFAIGCRSNGVFKPLVRPQASIFDYHARAEQMGLTVGEPFLPGTALPYKANAGASSWDVGMTNASGGYLSAVLKAIPFQLDASQQRAITVRATNVVVDRVTDWAFLIPNAPTFIAGYRAEYVTVSIARNSERQVAVGVAAAVRQLPIPHVAQAVATLGSIKYTNVSAQSVDFVVKNKSVYFGAEAKEIQLLSREVVLPLKAQLLTLRSNQTEKFSPGHERPRHKIFGVPTFEYVPKYWLEVRKVGNSTNLYLVNNGPFTTDDKPLKKRGNRWQMDMRVKGVIHLPNDRKRLVRLTLDAIPEKNGIRIENGAFSYFDFEYRDL